MPQPPSSLDFAEVIFRSFLAAFCISLSAAELLAQQPAPQADPRDFELIVPEAPAKPGGDRRVLAPVEGRDPVVAKVFVEVGDRLVVLLPNGRLDSILTRDATETDRKFEPAGMDEMAAELTGGAFQGFRTRRTKRYLYVYNTSQPFYLATSRILETMYPSLLAYCKRRKLPVHDPEMPLVVIMFKTQEEFDKYHKMPEGVAAYYNGVSNHVVMYEQSKLVEIAPELAVKQSISVIAHEGVHQILHNIGVQQRLSRWPIWISEGLPEYFAPTTVGNRIRWKGVGVVNDIRMKELEEYLAQGPAGGPNELVRPTVEAQALTSTGYASAWALTHYLAERRQEKFFAFLAEVSQAEPLKQMTSDEQVALFEKHFGDDFLGHEKALVKHLQKLPYSDPIINQTHYVAMIETDLVRMAIVSFSPAAVQQWQREQLTKLQQAKPRYSIRAFPSRDAANVFAQRWLNQ
ncbi:MAG: DUF1570 domain-containing protein [Pirellulales bacterium]